MKVTLKKNTEEVCSCDTIKGISRVDIDSFLQKAMDVMENEIFRGLASGKDIEVTVK